MASAEKIVPTNASQSSKIVRVSLDPILAQDGGRGGFGTVLFAARAEHEKSLEGQSLPGFSSLRPEADASETSEIKNNGGILDIFRFRSRGGEFVLGTLDPLVPRPARVAQDLALALQLQAEIDNEGLTYRELAERHNWSRMKACRLLPLARLVPEIQAEVASLTTTVAGEPIDRDTLLWIASAPNSALQQERFAMLARTWQMLMPPAASSSHALLLSDTRLSSAEKATAD